MSIISFTINATALSRLFARAEAPLARAVAESPEERGVPFGRSAGITCGRRLGAFLFVSVLAVSLAAQSIGPGQLQKGIGKMPEPHALITQSRLSAESELRAAQEKGSEVVSIIELPEPMLPQAIEYRRGSGKLVAVYIRSLTTEWNGVAYSTADSPITGFSQAVERFSENHQRLNPDDHASIFGVEAFAVRTTAESAQQWLTLFPGAELAYARDLSPEAVAKYRALKAAGMTDVYVPRRAGAEQKLESQTAQSQSSAQAASAPFLPTSATLSIEATSPDRRMISGSFSWSSDAALAGLKTPLSTLEIQTLFWNHAPKSQPKATYVGDMIDYAARWPSSYYDTNFLDDSGFQGDPQKRSYTVGAWDARNAFKPNTTYSFWIATKPGSLSANLVEFSAQKGTYLPTPPAPLLPDMCVVNRSLCVWPIGQTDWFSPSVPYGQGARQFSIVAPTVYPFTYPKSICDIPPGQPQLSTDLKNLSLSDGLRLGEQMAAVQKAFKDGGGKPGVGCATSRLHEDKTWWPRGGKTQDFDGNQSGKGKGAIMLAPGASQAFWIHGAIWTRYSSDSFKGPRSVIGEPAGNEQAATSPKGTNGAYQSFTRGYLYFNSATNQTFYVANAIADRYRSVGLHKDSLGFPTSDEFPWQNGARSNFEGGYIYWTAAGGAVIVRNQQASLPTISTHSWNTTPVAGKTFGGTISGTGFVSGATQVFFCLAGSTTCYPHPSAGVTVNSPTSLTVTNVNLSAGTWQFYVKTSAGASTRSAAFTVQSPPPPPPPPPPSLPTVTGYSWDAAPVAGKTFGGTISGTRFVSGATQVFFCQSGNGTCYQHPSAGVTVNSTTRLSVSNVKLGSGSWQVYVRTSAGPSSRSAAFTVR